MPTLTNTYQVTIQAPPEKVFAYVSDLTRHPEWSGGQLKVESRSSGPIAAGSQYVSYGELLNEKERKNELRVTQFKPPGRFAFIAKDPGVGEVLHTFTFKPQGNGTLVERVVTHTQPALRAFGFRFLINPLVSNPMMEKAMARLKARLEGQPDPLERR